MPDRSSFSYGTGFRSLTVETPAPVALAVTGTLPAWLAGTLLRTGPAKFEVGARTYNHWPLSRRAGIRALSRGKGRG